MRLQSVEPLRHLRAQPGTWTTEGYDGDAEPPPRVATCRDRVEVGFPGGRKAFFPIDWTSTCICELKTAVEEEFGMFAVKLLFEHRFLDVSKTLAEEGVPDCKDLAPVEAPA